MNTILFLLFACGEKEEDTGIDVDDTGVEDTDTEDTSDTEDTEDTEDTSDTEDTEDTHTDPEELAYIGTYTDSWGGEQTIAADTWTSGSLLFHISQFSNNDGFIIAQNDSEARSQYCSDWTLYTQEDCEAAGETWTDLADKWSRFDIASDADGGLHYCQITYDAETEEDAMAVSADANDLAAGCNGFGWSEIRIKFAYTGTYDDNWGGSHTINAFKWDSGSLLFHVSQYSNDEGWLIAQNDSKKRSQYCSDWMLATEEDCTGAGETWTDLADKWSRFDIASDADGGLHYCQIAFGADTEEDALAVSADANDLATGCNGFGWTQFITE